jgi:hypothetical protein
MLVVQRSMNREDVQEEQAWALPISRDLVAAATEELLILAEVDRHAELVPGKVFGIVGRDPSGSKCNRLHVVIFRQLPWLLKLKAPEILPLSKTGQPLIKWLGALVENYAK